MPPAALAADWHCPGMGEGAVRILNAQEPLLLQTAETWRSTGGVKSGSWPGNVRNWPERQQRLLELGLWRLDGGEGDVYGLH